MREIDAFYGPPRTLFGGIRVTAVSAYADLLIGHFIKVSTTCSQKRLDQGPLRVLLRLAQLLCQM
jgi:hypothetical protein